MGTLLKIAGGLWAAVGAVSIALDRLTASGISRDGVIFSAVVFVLPGLVALGIGARISRRT